MRLKLWTCATRWVQGIIKEGGFSVRKWNSNCEPFREWIKQDEEKKNQLTVEAPPSEKESARNHSEEE